MKFTRELNLIVAGVNFIIQGTEEEEFRILLHDYEIDWSRVHELVDYHQIVTLFYKACTTVSFTNHLVKEYEIFSKRHAIKNVIFKNECIGLIHLLKVNHIKAVPHKGVLYLEKLYNNEPIRQMSDIDILVHEDDAENAINLLIKEGYAFAEPLDFENIKQLIAKKYNKEVSLNKLSSTGIKIPIDFHWHINHREFHELPVEWIMENTVVHNWNGHEIEVPNDESLFIMLLSHHGTRDFWGRIKFLVDLNMFLNKFPEKSINDLSIIAARYKMEQTFLFGVDALNDMLVYKSSHKKDKRWSVCLKELLNIWERADSFKGDIIPKFRIMSLQRKLQDRKLSWYGIIKQEMRIYSKGNLSFSGSPLAFPEKYVFLNAFSRIVSSIVKRQNFIRTKLLLKKGNQN